MTGEAERPATRVRIPADVDRPDTLLAGLTARQLAILAAAGVLAWAGYLATRALVPVAVFAALAVPVAGVVITVALGRRDGLGADQLLAAALRQLRAPRRMVLAPDGVPAPPAFTPRGGRRPAPLVLPLVGITGAGVIDLGADGAAVICRASAVTFALRTPAEQQALVAGFARWLNSLDAGVQILTRATPLDLHRRIAALVDAAPGLPHPGLETAALDYAWFLSDLAAHTELLTQEVLLVFRQPRSAGPGEDPGVRLVRRAAEAGVALGAAGVRVSLLAGPAAAACLSSCLDPGAAEHPAGLATPTSVITATQAPC
ncbi:MAG: PrgI family protein [Mycobacteriales bacterium]